ncbi:MAG: hypothetical protein COB77_02820 [Gammaproteobacteria bacterium]|nr:MAG: hypothetical protein COB77_02820 [Gammaproteobacteria bacterium]
MFFYSVFCAVFVNKNLSGNGREIILKNIRYNLGLCGFGISMMLKIVAANNKVGDTVNIVKQYFNIFTALIFSLLLFSSNVFSAAGDLISNTATISYDLAGVPTMTNASTTFTEDRRVNFVVAASNGGLTVPVISDMTDAVMQFIITNTGNDTHDFLIAAVNTSPNPFGLPADYFDPLLGTVQTFVESGVTNGYQAVEDTAVFVDELAPGVSSTVYVLADMPTVVIDDVAAVVLIAQVAEGGSPGIEGAFINADDNGRISPDSAPAGDYGNGATNVPAGVSTINADTLGMETVFNDPAGLNIEDLSTALVTDIVGNGQHSDAGAYQVKSPVNIVKSVTVIDTLGGNDPHSGATLRYQLNVTVVGNVAVDDLVIVDAIPANTTYTDDSIILNGVSQTDVIDLATDYSRAIDILSKPVVSIEVDLSEGGVVAIGSGVTNTIIFEVTIN